MTILKGMLLSALAVTLTVTQSNVAAAQPTAQVTPDNFTTDPLFRQYVNDEFQLSRALATAMAKVIDDSHFTPEIKSLAPALPGCMDIMRKAMLAMVDDQSIHPLMSKLRSLSFEERQHFATFSEFLHTPDGTRLIALNHQAMAVSDQLDSDGLPQLTSEHDSKLAEMGTLLQRQPKASELPQTLFGLALYMQAITDQSQNDGEIDEARKKVFATPPCVAFKQQVEAYDKMHPKKQ
ncbi:hypothetical protein [Novosphingobium terrae]|uniref:hypothetical protein n=1 Tax=Novosphingobium terrae TaxID=2726189 RepID=UPI00197DDEA7|nr:hypothetical protein [Novosphingobium terrae]